MRIKVNRRESGTLGAPRPWNVIALVARLEPDNKLTRITFIRQLRSGPSLTAFTSLSGAPVGFEGQPRRLAPVKFFRLLQASLA